MELETLDKIWLKRLDTCLKFMRNLRQMSKLLLLLVTKNDGYPISVNERELAE